METFIQPFIIAFREGLEAFLILAILLEFLDKTNNSVLKKSVWHGATLGVIISVIAGDILMSMSSWIQDIQTTAKIWESGASFIAVLLITTFIVWMIKHGNTIKAHIKNKASENLSKKGIFLLALVVVAREGGEIAIFAFAGKYAPLPIIVGVLLSLLVALLIHHSIVRIPLKMLFTITLAYLILQAGYLIGYSIHEGISATKSIGALTDGHWLTQKAFDLSNTILSHKTGTIGLPLHVLFGWYSKPEWIQLIVQYGYTMGFFVYWGKRKTNRGDQ